MKKIKVIFWVLGFGCGIVFSGIIGTWITLQVNVRIQNQSQGEIFVSDSAEETKIENQNPIQNDKSRESLIEDKSSIAEKEVNNNQIVVNNNEELIGSGDNRGIEKNEKKQEDYCEIFIPSTSGASEICKILEEAGIVENGKAFHDYIKEKGKQAYLKDGHFTLPKDADYETLLALLVV